MTSSDYSFRNGFVTMSMPAKLILLVAVAIFCLIAGMIIAFLAAIPLFHHSFNELLNVMAHPAKENLAIIKYFQIFQTITFFLIPSLFVAWLVSKNPADYLKLKKGTSFAVILLVLMSIFTATPFMNALMQLNSKLNLPDWLDSVEQKMILQEKAAAQLTEMFLYTKTTGDLLFNFAMIAVLPAIAEEFLFRGTLQRMLSDWIRNEHIAIFTAAFIFSFVHFQFFGFLPRFLLGVYFGYLLWWTGSLWVPVTAHLINNGMAVIYYHFSSEKIGNTKLDTVGTQSNYVLYISVFLTCMLIGSIYIQAKNRKSA